MDAIKENTMNINVLKFYRITCIIMMLFTAIMIGTGFAVGVPFTKTMWLFLNLATFGLLISTYNNLIKSELLRRETYEQIQALLSQTING